MTRGRDRSAACVRAGTPLAGPGHGQIAIRVVRILIYINEREALNSFLDAWQQASDLADKAFGATSAEVRAAHQG